MESIQEKANEFAKGVDLGSFESVELRKSIEYLLMMFAKQNLADNDTEIKELHKALDETKERLRISEKVIAQKNATPRSAASGHAGMTLNEYQSRAMKTCLPSSDNDCYMLFGLVEEVGELCGKVSKVIRKGQEATLYNNFHPTARVESDAEFKEQLKLEAGDVLWMLAGLCKRFGWTLEEVAQYNLDKLAARKDADTIVTHTDH